MACEKREMDRECQLRYFYYTRYDLPHMCATCARVRQWINTGEKPIVRRRPGAEDEQIIEGG